MSLHFGTLALSAAASLAALARVSAFTIDVINTNDTGDGSLRQSIMDCNTNPGPDVIHFKIPGGGLHKITPQSPLPTITDRILIDGYSQPEASPNTRTVGNDAVLLIGLDGSGAGSNAIGLDISAGPSIIRGLVIGRFSGRAIQLSNNGGNVIIGNFIGTDPGGNSVQQNANGILMFSSPDNQIGGTTPAARNLLSGNIGTAIETFTSSNNIIQGNYIGTNAAGTAVLGNGIGIFLAPVSDNNHVGGTAAGAPNVISGQDRAAVSMQGTIGNVVEGNLIGTDPTGKVRLGNNLSGAGGCAVCITGNRNPFGTGGGPATDNRIGGTAAGAENVIAGYIGPGAAIFVGGSSVGDSRRANANIIQGNYIGTNSAGALLGNQGNGVYIQDGDDNLIGGLAAGAGNVIANSRLFDNFSGGSGVLVGGGVGSGVGNSILGNSIYNSERLGIDLVSSGNDPVTPNDADDSDVGPNNLQNFPFLLGSTLSNGQVRIVGGLQSRPKAKYRIEFFGNSAINASGSGEGRTFLGATGVTTGANGRALFDVSFPGQVGERVTGTATDVSGNTSEFSPPPPLPIITSPPFAERAVNVLFVHQFETRFAISLEVNNLPKGLFYFPKLRAIGGTPKVPGTYQVHLRATNMQGATTKTLVLRILPAPPPNTPRIKSGTAATARVGVPFQFQVISSGATAAARLSAADLPPGLVADPVTGRISGTPTTEGDFAPTLTVTNGDKTFSETVQFTITADPARPVITSPSEATLTSGHNFNYTIAASASDPDDPVSYSILGTLPKGLNFDAATGTISGTFSGLRSPAEAAALDDDDDSDGHGLSGGVITNVQLFATNSTGTGTFPLIFYLAPTGVVNISTRLAVGVNENVLIGGFILTGNAPKKLILRAIGPSLKAGDAPLAGRLQNPILELRDSAGAVVGSNDDWRSAQEQEIIDIGVPPPNDRESAIVALLQAPAAYTAVLSGVGETSGIGLVEVYDLGTASLDTTSKAQLANISTRGRVQQGDAAMIGGIIISGSSAKVIVRAIGPDLTNQGVSGVLQDTTLEVVNANGSLIRSNDDWRTGGQEEQIIDTTVPPKDDRESAVVATLTAGAYTAVVRGKGETTGVALVEAYVIE